MHLHPRKLCTIVSQAVDSLCGDKEDPKNGVGSAGAGSCRKLPQSQTLSAWDDALLLKHSPEITAKATERVLVDGTSGSCTSRSPR